MAKSFCPKCGSDADVFYGDKVMKQLWLENQIKRMLDSQETLPVQGWVNLAIN